MWFWGRIFDLNSWLATWWLSAAHPPPRQHLATCLSATHLPTYLCPNPRQILSEDDPWNTVQQSRWGQGRRNPPAPANVYYLEDFLHCQENLLYTKKTFYIAGKTFCTIGKKTFCTRPISFASVLEGFAAQVAGLLGDLGGSSSEPPAPTSENMADF